MDMRSNSYPPLEIAGERRQRVCLIGKGRQQDSLYRGLTLILGSARRGGACIDHLVSGKGSGGGCMSWQLWWDQPVHADKALITDRT